MALTVLEALSGSAARLAKRRLLDKRVGPFERKAAAIFKIEGARFLEGLSAFRSEFPAVESISPDQWNKALDKALTESDRSWQVLHSDQAPKALRDGALAQAGALGVDISFDLANPRAVEFMKQAGAKMVSGIGDTTRGYIKTVMVEAVENGWSYDRAAKAISDRYHQFAVGSPQAHIASRAHLVATTEMAKAYEYGNRLIAEELGSTLPMQKAWLTVGDEALCGDCEGNEGEGWIDLDTPFGDGSDEPPSHPACRCTTLYQQVPA